MNPRDYRGVGNGEARDAFVGIKRAGGPGDRYGDDAFKRFREDNDRDQPDILAIIR